VRRDPVASGWLRVDGWGRSRGQAVGDGVAVPHEDSAEPDAFGGRAEPDAFGGRAEPDAFGGRAEPDAFRGHGDPDAVGVAVASPEPVAEPDAG